MSNLKKWGPWEIKSAIGEGGAGHVFKVRNVETDQLGALKRLKNPNRIERFKREIDAVKRLTHPNVVPLLDANVDHEPFYAVYEFEPGKSLADLTVEELRAIPITQRLQLCEQICSALQTAHELSIIHRDIKPDNILVSLDRKQVRLCDFGLVYCNDGGERQTATMEQVGSRYYIPPELEDGRADQVSARSDIYSVGKVLYYLVRGKIFSRERHRDPEYNLAVFFSDPYLEAVSQILDKTVTDSIDSRVPDAATLKSLIENARMTIAERRPVQGVPETYKCVFCKIGTYTEVCISGETKCHNNGYDEGNVGNEHMVYLECNNCGNSQRFKLKTGGDKWFTKSHDRLHRSLR